MHKKRKIIEAIIGMIVGIPFCWLLLFVFEYRFYHVILFIIFLYTFNTFIHEIGHMVFGKLVGINVWKIQIGLGEKVIFKFRFFGTLIELTNRIESSFSRSDYLGNKISKKRIFICTFGGIFFTICTALVACLISTNVKSKSLSMIMMVFCHSNIFSAILNLIPSKVSYLGEVTPNDALKLTQIPFYDEKQLQEYLISGKISHAVDLIKEKKYSEAKEILSKAAEAFPDAKSVKINLVYIYIKELKIEKAYKMNKELLNNINPSEKNYEYIIMYNLAYLSLFDNSYNNESADNYSKQIYNDYRDYIPYKIVRGCVLVNTKRIDEGIAILRNCVNLEKGIDKNNNNILAFLYLSYAFYKKDKTAKAIEYIKVVEPRIDKLDKDVKYLYEKIINKTNNFDRK